MLAKQALPAGKRLLMRQPKSCAFLRWKPDLTKPELLPCPTRRLSAMLRALRSGLMRAAREQCTISSGPARMANACGRMSKRRFHGRDPRWFVLLYTTLRSHDRWILLRKVWDGLRAMRGRAKWMRAASEGPRIITRCC